MLLAGLLLLGTLLPERILNNERFEGYVEKLLTWFLAAGLLGSLTQWPERVRAFAHSCWGRSSSALLVLTCLAFIGSAIALAEQGAAPQGREGRGASGAAGTSGTGRGAVPTRMAKTTRMFKAPGV